MSSFVENGFPAGDESDISSDEWDLGWHPARKSPHMKVLDAVVPDTADNVSLLKRAIDKGDTDTVEQLLNNGMDVNARLEFEWTPLMCAASVGNYDVAKLLLDRGAIANFSKDNWTVLMASCTASASEDKITACVGLLLSRNADPNMVDRCHMSCLMLAARNGHSKVINLLVSHGAEINRCDREGYTALSIAVQYNKEEAVLKLLQLGADKTIRTKAGQSPANLAETLKHTQIAKILAASSHIATSEAFSSTEEILAKFFDTNFECAASKESVTKLDELELFLHGLDLAYLTDIMSEHDITWSHLLTMEREDLEKIGITNPVDQQKVLSAVQQMHLDKVDLETISHIEATEPGSEELQNFLISVNQQCCYLTEAIQDLIGRFPRQASQLVFALDAKREVQATCCQLVVQTKDLHKEVICLRNLLCQMDESRDCCRLPGLGSHSSRTWRYLTRIALSTLGITVILILYKAPRANVDPHLFGNVF